MIYAEMKDNNVIGFYTEEIHGIEKCISIIGNGGLKVDEELWQYILSLGQVELIGEVEQREYTILDRGLFKQGVQSDTTPQQPSMEERIVALELLMMGVI